MSLCTFEFVVNVSNLLCRNVLEREVDGALCSLDDSVFHTVTSQKIKSGGLKSSNGTYLVTIVFATIANFIGTQLQGDSSG